jgi:porphobilinogen synthase
MNFPDYRPRRLRQNENFRRMVRETKLSVDNLIYPLFAVPGAKVKKPIDSMPGIFQMSVDHLIRETQRVKALGIPAVLLFGIPDKKDAIASGAMAKDGIIQQAIRGMLEKGDVENDATIEVLAETAVSHAKAGADMVAPSAMMDGQIAALREGLDDAGFDTLPIMAYSAKYASCFYGPFREAAESTPAFGDRRAYQMDPANSDEAMREITLDVAEGADIIMVKPALAYLDVIRRAKEEFDLPLAAYNVSGEYSMIKAAAQMGWIDGERAMLESVTAIRRAGADMIITYFAPDIAKILGT